MPQPVSTISYNSANQQTAFGSQSLSYDNNGNLTSDGINSYGWNARNQLVSMSGPGLAATFQYDSSGRRISESINGATTGYLYDGVNVVQEQVAAGNVNIVAGGIDEVFTRTDSTSTLSPVGDRLGSVVALTDSSGTIQTQYSYEPFGKTTASGASSANPSQYTSRENDWTGLYYYRARYYSPSLQRFISEDPIGFLGGDVNLYGYVGNDPIGFIDPDGRVIFIPILVGAGAGALGSILGQGIGNLFAGRNFFDCFDWKAVGIAAVGGALTGGVGAAGFITSRITTVEPTARTHLSTRAEKVTERACITIGRDITPLPCSDSSAKTRLGCGVESICMPMFITIHSPPPIP